MSMVQRDEGMIDPKTGRPTPHQGKVTQVFQADGASMRDVTKTVAPFLPKGRPERGGKA